jgi:hypothetical protein
MRVRATRVKRVARRVGERVEKDGSQDAFSHDCSRVRLGGGFV